MHERVRSGRTLTRRTATAVLLATIGVPAADAQSVAPRAVSRADAAAPRPRIATNVVSWFAYSGEHPLGRRFRLVLEETARRAGGVRVWQQLEALQGLTYVLRPGVELTSGYTYVVTYPYGDLPVAERRPEHRAWEEVELSGPTGRVQWESRTRAEHRWIGRPDTSAKAIADDRWTESTRLRQRLGATVPLGRDRVGVGDWYLTPTAEAFLRVAPAAGAGGFVEETRTAVAFGRRVGRHTRVEAGYLFQLARRARGREQERNHALLLTLRSDARWAR